MRRFLALLVLLVIAQSWGIFGAWRTMGLRYTCTTRVGPLCYAWEASPIGKLLGDDGTKRVEEALQSAKDDLEKHVIDKMTSGGLESLDKVIEEMKDMAKDGLDNAKKMIEKSSK